MPFLVYLLPLVTFFLCFTLKTKKGEKLNQQDADAAGTAEVIDASKFGKNGIMGGKIIQIMIFYLFATYTVNVIPINLSILLEQNGYDSMISGWMMAIWFFFIMLPGFFINPLINFMKRSTKMICMILVGVGLWFMIMTPHLWTVVIGCVLSGFGFGIIQPQLYNKTTLTAVPKKMTFALSLMMSMNYLALLMAPYVIQLFKDIFGNHTQQFGFVINIGFAILMFIWALVGRRSFLFDDKVE